MTYVIFQFLNKLSLIINIIFIFISFNFKVENVRECCKVFWVYICVAQSSGTQKLPN